MFHRTLISPTGMPTGRPASGLKEIFLETKALTVLLETVATRHLHLPCWVQVLAATGQKDPWKWSCLCQGKAGQPAKHSWPGVPPVSEEVSSQQCAGFQPVLCPGCSLAWPAALCVARLTSWGAEGCGGGGDRARAPSFCPWWKLPRWWMTQAPHLSVSQMGAVLAGRLWAGLLLGLRALGSIVGESGGHAV